MVFTGIIEDTIAASFATRQSETILARSCDAGKALHNMATKWQRRNRSLAWPRILSPLRLPFRHIGAASVILTGFYRAPKAICYPVREYF
jgi:hypothetical protein